MNYFFEKALLTLILIVALAGVNVITLTRASAFSRLPTKPTIFRRLCFVPSSTLLLPTHRRLFASSSTADSSSSLYPLMSSSPPSGPAVPVASPPPPPSSSNAYREVFSGTVGKGRCLAIEYLPSSSDSDRSLPYILATLPHDVQSDPSHCFHGLLSPSETEYSLRSPAGPFPSSSPALLPDGSFLLERVAARLCLRTSGLSAQDQPSAPAIVSSNGSATADLLPPPFPPGYVVSVAQNSLLSCAYVEDIPLPLSSSPLSSVLVGVDIASLPPPSYESDPSGDMEFSEGIMPPGESFCAYAKYWGMFESRHPTPSKRASLILLRSLKESASKCLRQVLNRSHVAFREVEIQNVRLDGKEYVLKLAIPQTSYTKPFFSAALFHFDNYYSRFESPFESPASKGGEGIANYIGALPEGVLTNVPEISLAWKVVQDRSGANYVITSARVEM